jgi:hypothetical protein
MHPRMELQRNKIDKNSARVLALRLFRAGPRQRRASNRMKLLFRHHRTFETQTDGHRVASRSRCSALLLVTALRSKARQNCCPIRSAKFP